MNELETASRTSGPELLGIRLSRIGPIHVAFLDLKLGVTVLYGVNGVGKSHALRGIRSAFDGGVGGGGAELHFRLRPASWTTIQPSNPWVFLARTYQAPGFFYDRTLTVAAAEFERHQALVGLAIRELDLAEGEVNSIADCASRLSHEVSAVLLRDVKAMVDVVSQGRFIRTSWGRLSFGGVVAGAGSALREVWEEHFSNMHPDDLDCSLDDFRKFLVDANTQPYMANDSMHIQMEMRSVLHAHRGDLTPLWCADSYGLNESKWGPWPAPVLDPDDIWNQNEYTLRLLTHLLGIAADIENPANGTDAFSGFSIPTEQELVENLARGVNGVSGLQAVGPRLDELPPVIDLEVLLDTHEGAVRIKEPVYAIAREISEEASRLFALLFMAAPALTCDVAAISRWPRDGVVNWFASDPSGAKVPVDQLSDAQRRWALFAIRLALGRLCQERAPIVIIDEPERALHRRAERHLMAGLSVVADEFGSYVIMATHSPAMLSNPAAHLNHVARDSFGSTVILPFPSDLRTRIDELGLDPADLLQRCRTVLLVEGQHDWVILDQLFGEDFRLNGVEVFSMRGARNLRNAADAQLLFQYSDARVIALVDNEDHQRVTDIWARAREAHGIGSDHLSILGEFTKGNRGAEAGFLKEFCAATLAGNAAARFEVAALSKADVLEYLPLRSVAPGVGDEATWEQVHEVHRRSSSGVPFKDWLKKNYQADFSDEQLRRAAADVGHSDLTNILNLVVEYRGQP